MGSILFVSVSFICFCFVLGWFVCLFVVVVFLGGTGVLEKKVVNKEWLFTRVVSKERF